MTPMEVGASFIAKRAKAGQPITLRVNEFGGRIPLTTADYDREEDTITIALQKVGKTILLPDQLEEGGKILNFIGPLGITSHLGGYKKTAVVGGDAGCAITYPQAKALHEMGIHVDMTAGLRDQDTIIPRNEMYMADNNLFLMTDDDFNGNKGSVTDALKTRTNIDADYGLVVAIGPLPMTRVVNNLTRSYGIKTTININPIMISDTGMRGDRRVIVGSGTEPACADGPDFDGHLADFDEATLHTRTYREDEAGATHEYNCHLMEGVRND